MMIEHKLNPQRTEQQGKRKIDIRWAARLDDSERPLPIYLTCQNQGHQPTINELDTVAHNALAGFPEKWVPVDINAFESLICARIEFRARTNDCNIESRGSE
jgi:hypothetical protein